MTQTVSSPQSSLFLSCLPVLLHRTQELVLITRLSFSLLCGFWRLKSTTWVKSKASSFWFFSHLYLVPVSWIWGYMSLPEKMGSSGELSCIVKHGCQSLLPMPLHSGKKELELWPKSGRRPYPTNSHLTVEPRKELTGKDWGLVPFGYDYVLGYLTRPHLRTKFHCSSPGSSEVGWVCVSLVQVSPCECTAAMRPPRLISSLRSGCVLGPLQGFRGTSKMLYTHWIIFLEGAWDTD